MTSVSRHWSGTRAGRLSTTSAASGWSSTNSSTRNPSPARLVGPVRPRNGHSRRKAAGAPAPTDTCSPSSMTCSRWRRPTRSNNCGVRRHRRGEGDGGTERRPVELRATGSRQHRRASGVLPAGEDSAPRGRRGGQRTDRRTGDDGHEPAHPPARLAARRQRAGGSTNRPRRPRCVRPAGRPCPGDVPGPRHTVE